MFCTHESGSMSQSDSDLAKQLGENQWFLFLINDCHEGVCSRGIAQCILNLGTKCK
jgi:hypothetical protein